VENRKTIRGSVKINGHAPAITYNRRSSLRVSIVFAVVIALFVIILFIFLFFFVWLLSKEDIGSYPVIDRV